MANLYSFTMSIQENAENVYRDYLGSLSLVNYEKSINQIIDAAKPISENENKVSQRTYNNYFSLIKDIEAYFSHISKLSSEEFTKEHSNIKVKLREFYDIFLDLIPFLDEAFNDDEANLNRITKFEKQIDEAVMLKDVLKDEVNKLEQKIENIDERYKDVIPKVELLNQKEIFKKESDSNQTTAYIWLIIIVVIGVGLFYLFQSILNDFCFEVSCFNETKLSAFNEVCVDCGQNILWLEMFKALIFRFLIISLGIYALAFGVKNFNTAMHNRTVNKHKQNSFEAALILIEQTSAEGKDSIVSLAAQAIFTQQKTGYLGKENDALNASIIEQILNRTK